MGTVSLLELQQHTASLLARVEAGEKILISLGDRTVAELRPVVAPRSRPRPFGLAAGAFILPNDFDSPLPEDVIQGFEGQ